MILERKIPLNYLLKKIKWNILIVTLFSSVVHYLSVYFIDFDLPISVGAFLGTAIALILSFKLSHSYDRWWEARKIWGAIVNDSRSFVVQLKNFSSNEETELVESMSNRQIAWCYSLGQSLRNLNPIEGCEHFIAGRELETIKSQKNIPLALLDNHSNDLKRLHKRGQINDFQQIQIDNTIVRLCASMGMAERIKNTTFPKTYRLTLHYFIYLFLMLLSFSLTELHNFIEIPLLALISIPFFLLDKIAVHIQDPFENRPTDTAMTAIARTIEINIKQLLGKENIPESLSSDEFYIM